MLPEDLDSLIWCSRPALSPDGGTVAFVVTRVHAEENSYRSQVWLAATDGHTAPHPFTAGEHRDGEPCWSPDGSLLAFTSTRGEEEQAEASVRVAPVAAGGETVTLAVLPEPATDLRWSPDGRLVAFCSRVHPEGYEAEDRRRPPRRITRLFSRLDSVGFTVDRPQHVHVVPADGSAAPRDLTPGGHEFADPGWCPDSAAIVVSGATHDRRDLELTCDLHQVQVATGEIRPLTARTGTYAHPAVSPDATRVAFLGCDDTETTPRNEHVGVLDLTTGAYTWVSAGLDRTFAPYPSAQAPVWLDHDTLLAGAEDRGDLHLFAVPADGAGDPVPVRAGEGVVTGYDAAGGSLAFTVTTPTMPAEVHVLAGGEERRLSFVTTGFAERARLRPYEHFLVPATDGTVDLDAWVLTPPDHDPSGSSPMLVNVHGGPFTQYANAFLDEVQMQARAGYVVVWCNPRGSSGREEAFGRAIVGEPLGGTGWGSVDYDDVMAVVEHAVEHLGGVDNDRVGILGGSYGGYMTSWAVGHTDRFRAAVSERAANNLLSMEWSSDASGAFRTYVGRTHLEDPGLYLRMSPISHVHDITTPLLLLHSEQDLRCSVEQAEQMFVALRMLEREVELVRFPGESHELSRSGSPTHRRQRMEIILDFVARHLQSPQEARP